MTTTAVVKKYAHYISSCIRKKTEISTELFLMQIKYMTLLYFFKNDELGEKLPKHQNLFTDRKFIRVTMKYRRNWVS